MDSESAGGWWIIRPADASRYEGPAPHAICATAREARGPGARTAFLGTILAAVALLTASCHEASESARTRVVATVLPVAGIVDRVAPGLVDVEVLIPPGANPVTHEPGLSDLRGASSADVVFQVGHPALAWEETWLTKLALPDGVEWISVAADCPAVPDDPHVWLSPSCTRMIAESVAGALEQVLPTASDSIQISLDAFLEEVKGVARAAADRLGGGRGQAFLSLHPAWGYLAREHGLEQIAILEHGAGDAGPGRLAAVIDRAREEGLRNVVVQPQFSTEAARLVAEELGGRVLPLDPLERDWSAGMREAIRVIGAEVAK